MKNKYNKPKYNLEGLRPFNKKMKFVISKKEVF